MNRKSLWCVAVALAVGTSYVVVAANDPAKENGGETKAQSLLAQRDEALKLIEQLSKANADAKAVIVELHGGIPAGTIVAYGGPCERPKDIPPGWLLCDGQAYDGANPEYRRLFGMIGKIWGPHEQPPADPNAPETERKLTFRVPDLRGRFLRGHAQDSNVDPDALKRTDLSGKRELGNVVGSYQADQVGPHNHPTEEKPHHHTISVRDGDGENDIDKRPNQQAADGEGREDGTPPTSGVKTDLKVLSNGTSETRPKNAAVNYLIKL